MTKSYGFRFIRNEGVKVLQDIQIFILIKKLKT